MTIRQLRFAQAYTEGYCASEAAIMAGYSALSAATNAHLLLKNTQVTAYIQTLWDDKQAKANEQTALLVESFRKVFTDEELTNTQRLKAQGQLIQLAKLQMKPKPRLSSTTMLINSDVEEDLSLKEPEILNYKGV
jgi:phage terminase small subunit